MFDQERLVLAIIPINKFGFKREPRNVLSSCFSSSFEEAKQGIHAEAPAPLN